MLDETISKIEARIEAAPALNDTNRGELLRLLGQLKTEVAQLSTTHQEDAESIASFAEVSAREATRGSRNPQLIEHSIGGLESSVGGFEKSHPQLVEVVNRIAGMLSNMGI
jgi:predicted transcriptional regulator